MSKKINRPRQIVFILFHQSPSTRCSLERLLLDSSSLRFRPRRSDSADCCWWRCIRGSRCPQSRRPNHGRRLPRSLERRNRRGWLSTGSGAWSGTEKKITITMNIMFVNKNPISLRTRSVPFRCQPPTMMTVHITSCEMIKSKDSPRIQIESPALKHSGSIGERITRELIFLFFVVATFP